MLRDSNHLSFLSYAAAAVATVSALLIAGCGVNGMERAGTEIPASVGGKVHGGQSPIQGATVTLYVTNPLATGYGRPATLIGTATTDADGGFTIGNSATPANCPAGQQAYITAAGGYPSGSPTLLNNSVLMMAALGDCANVNASTFVIINEVTTVAAAYALSGFMTTSASGPLFVANVSAPAANNAETGTATVAAGLPHAFLNAANLANFSGGSANSSTANVSVGGTTFTGAVPAVVINTLGDILQACVNQATGDTLCAKLFGFTPSITGTLPVNTLQSMINLARNPYPSAAAMNSSTGLLGLAASAPAFVPVLSVAPPDWSLAIVYKNSIFWGPYATTMDANDTVYAGRGSTQANIIGLSPYGVATPKFTTMTSYGGAANQIAADAFGNVWATTSGSVVVQFSTTAGGNPINEYTIGTAGTPKTFGVAVDKSGNVWVGNEAVVTGNIVELANAAGVYTQNYTATAPGGFAPVAVTIDAQQNIWTGDYYTSGNLASVLPNLAAATPNAAPVYASSGTIAMPVSATFSKSTKPWGLVIDASANAWYDMVGSPSATTSGVEEVIPALTNSVITGLTPQAVAASALLQATFPQYPAIDGAGTIFTPNTTSPATGLLVYSTVASTVSTGNGSQILSPSGGYLGCYPLSTSPTTCGNGTTSAPYAVYNPKSVSIDSTGSVWTAISTGGFTQMVGLAAPSWPLLASGNPGLSPGLTAVNPLP
jgi:hypothetical protein